MLIYVGTNAACYTCIDSNVALTSMEGSDIKQVKMNVSTLMQDLWMMENSEMCLKRQTNHMAQESLVAILAEFIATMLPCY